MKKFDEYAEWFLLLVEAKNLGITVKEIEAFLGRKANSDLGSDNHEFWQNTGRCKSL